jgi:cyclophilin family peptidyl-prolyl cis-trans isomerase
MTVSRILFLLAGGFALSAHAQTSAPTVSRAIPSQTLSPNGATLALNLSDYFTISGVNGPVVQFDTVLGKFDVELRPDVAPKQVANFLGYVDRGDYANSFFHRSATLDGGPISIVQGGGYYVTNGSVAAVPTQAPVPLEYNLANDRGTLAAARTGDVNSATSQWYINVRDNSALLGPSNGGGYTVFGRVLGSGMSVVDALAALPRVNAGSPFDELPVRNYSSGSVQISNLALVNSITTASLFPTDTTPAVATFSAQSSASGVVAAALTGSVLALTPGAAGTATITVRATDVSGASVDTSFNVTVAAVPPTFATQPSSYTIAAGDSVVFRAMATNATSYQWQRNGADIDGATTTMLVIRNVGANDAGNYTLIARNASGAATSSAATLTVNSTVSAADRGRLVNLSIRSNSGIGGDVLTVGFALGGASGNAPLLLRAAGPSLARFNVSSYLADPVATLFSGSTAIAANDNWGGNSQVTALAHQVAAFDYLSANSLDAAMVVSPAAGTYSMQITGNGGGTGMSLGEVYEGTPHDQITAATPRLVNISARTQVGTGDNVLVAGFVIGGSTAKTLLVRAVGPALAQFNVPGVLADPKLQILSNGGATILGENDDWGGDPQINAAASSVAAFRLTDGASKDAALLITLPPGTYTAQESGVGGTTGIGLVEVYELP